MFGNQKKLRVTLMAAAIAFAGGTFAESTAPADVIKTRQQGLKDMGAAFKTVRDQLKAASPDTAAIKTAAGTIQKTADAMAKWFPKGSGPEVGVKTAAKVEIWNDAGGFSDARQKLVEESAKFAQTAAGGDAAAIGGGVRGLGMACKGCHDKFREKDDDAK
jgi:cytochrome c556